MSVAMKHDLMSALWDLTRMDRIPVIKCRAVVPDERLVQHHAMRFAGRYKTTETVRDRVVLIDVWHQFAVSSGHRSEDGTSSIENQSAT